MEIITLYSGSKGNATYICDDTKENGILIDCGVSFLSLKESLNQYYKRDLNSIRAVFVTHEHTDHIKGLYSLVKKLGIKIYANEKTAAEILKKTKVLEKDIKVFSGKAAVGEMEICSFKTSHDAVDSVGYSVFYKDKKIALATDIGIMTKEILEGISDCNAVVLESNHDIAMLKNGNYPYFLKQRILSSKGHLSNEDCAKTALYLARCGLGKLILAHLSDENNTALLAKSETSSLLKSAGVDMENEFLLKTAGQFGDREIIYV